jgi:hypothetical protein
MKAPPRFGWQAGVLMLAVTGLLGGCGVSAPDVFTFEGERYDDVASAIVDAMRDEGFVASRRDKRLGVFTSMPRTSPTMAEFFRPDNTTLTQAWESTLNHQRRRVRIEISPVDASSAPTPDVAAAMTQTTPNPDPVTLDEPSGLLNLRVIVYVDRQHEPLWRVETTTRRLSNHARDPALEERRMQPVYWEPISRDPYMERRIMDRIIRRTIEAGGPVPDYLRPRPDEPVDNWYE